MIEFLPPRDDAFGSGDPADFVGIEGDDEDWGDEPPRSRWLTALAVLGVTGLLAGGVIAAAPWSGDDATPAPTTTPSTTAPSTTEPRATTTTDPDDTWFPSGFDDSIPGWVLPEVDRFEFAGANSFPDSTADLGMSDPYDLWAQEGATRSEGTWLLISAISTPMTYLPLRADAAVAELGGGRTLISVQPDGVLEAVIDPIPGTPYVLTGRGIELERLAEIAAQIDVARGETSYGDLVDASGRLDGMVQLARKATTPLFGPIGLAPQTSSSYYDRAADEWLQITTALPADSDRDALDLVLAPTADEADLSPEERSGLERLRRLGLEPEVRTRGVIGNWWEASVVWPTSDGTIVSIMGTGSVSTMLEVASLAFPATTSQWSAYVRKSFNGINIEGSDSPSVPVARGSGAGAAWGAEVSRGRLSLFSENSYLYERFTPPTGQSITSYRNFTDGFLLITAPGPDAELQVAVEQAAADVSAPEPAAGTETTIVSDASPGSETTAPTSREPADSEPVPLVWVPDHDLAAIVIRIDPNLPFTVRWFDAQGAPVPGPER